MNFQDLLLKIKSLDESTNECGSAPSPAGMAGSDEILTGECGDMPGDLMHPSTPKQSDSVTMNVSMNGSGAGGIKDLMQILRNIEAGGDAGSDADDVLVGMEADEAFDNEPAPTTAGVDAVTGTGTDLASKGGEAEKVNGGGNPMGVDESLVTRLANLYNEVKSR